MPTNCFLVAQHKTFTYTALLTLIVLNQNKEDWVTSSKGPIFSEKYWYYIHCPKNVLRSILVFWIRTRQCSESQLTLNTISKSLFQDSFRHIFWAMKKMHLTFWKKATFINVLTIWKFKCHFRDNLNPLCTKFCLLRTFSSIHHCDICF